MPRAKTVHCSATQSLAVVLFIVQLSFATSTFAQKVPPWKSHRNFPMSRDSSRF